MAGPSQGVGVDRAADRGDEGADDRADEGAGHAEEGRGIRGGAGGQGATGHLGGAEVEALGWGRFGGRGGVRGASGGLRHEYR